MAPDCAGEATVASAFGASAEAALRARIPLREKLF
jgi:hypothetical protein